MNTIEVYAYMHLYMSDDNADLCTDIISAASSLDILLIRVKHKLSRYITIPPPVLRESTLLLYFHHMT